MAKQPKIRLAIEKWLKDNPDYKGTVKEMAKQISKETGYSQTSIRNAYYKGNFKNKPVAQNENNEEKPEAEKIIFKVDKSPIISSKANPLEELIIKTLWKWVSRDEFVKMSCDTLLESIFGYGLYHVDGPDYLTAKKTIKRALRKQVGIKYTFHGDILVAKSIPFTEIFPVAKSIYGVDNGDKTD